MSAKFRLVLGIICVLQTAAPAFCQQPAVDSGSTHLRLMSFNIRNGKANDGANRWENRKDFVSDLIKRQKLEIVGLQEAFQFQLKYLQQNLPEFSVIGEGRDGGQKGEFSAILVRKNRFTVIDSGTFWLSDTPEKKSKSWGNRYLRICTWARLFDKNVKKEIYFYNTHFDHQSQNSRIESAKLIARRIAQRKPSAPFVLMGDFNADENNEVVLFLKGKDPTGNLAKSPLRLKDTFRELNPTTTEVGTGGGFEGRKNGPKIDYIFVPDGVKTIKASIIRESRSGRYPSDHFPVFAEIKIQGSPAEPERKPLKVSSDFEGSSVRVLHIDQKTFIRNSLGFIATPVKLRWTICPARGV